MNLSKSIHNIYWHLECQQFRILFKVGKKVFGAASVSAALTTFLLNLDRFLAISSFYLDCVWSHERTYSKSRFKTLLQCSICYTALEFSLLLLACHSFYVLSGWCGLCHWFCVLLWGLTSSEHHLDHYESNSFTPYDWLEWRYSHFTSSTSTNVF